MSNLTSRHKKQVKRREQALVRAGEKPCCARLLAFDDPKGLVEIEMPCAGCDRVLKIRSRKEEATYFSKTALRLATESGKVCLHRVGEVIASEVVIDGEACPCGKLRWNVVNEVDE